MKKMGIMISFICLVFLLVTNANATYTVAYDPGTTNVTTALTGYSTTGAMMDGMLVTAYFSGGGNATLSWADTGATSGGVTGTNWSLVQDGDTFSYAWTLTGTSISSVFIDAGPGNTVFDVWGGAYYTDGSALGKAFQVTGGDTNLDILATYIDLVALSGDAPVGDLYRKLNIDFQDNPLTGILTFIADTDNLQFAGDIQPIPEPATMLLLGSGLIGLAGYARRRFKK